ncbi:3-hydroxyisobutyryl-CoA hydrolase [Striga asiatica]|uniref:3-hydroxyisobutyryl-CoA hydrolase n=1 Tax=Striga asiatica TaxID=4170 RepID=A0A5A7R2J1_STRAF|nr:3-hydroxyisobutyryl-CoA hydrolase [Striga asiatica]
MRLVHLAASRSRRDVKAAKHRHHATRGLRLVPARFLKFQTKVRTLITSQAIIVFAISVKRNLGLRGFVESKPYTIEDDPDSSAVTLVMHHGGQFEHVPKARYIDGSVKVFDYVERGHMLMENFVHWGKEKICDGKLRFYIMVDDAFNLVVDDSSFVVGYFDGKSEREMHVYVQVLEKEKDGISMEEHIDDILDSVEDSTYCVASESEDDDMIFSEHVDDISANFEEIPLNDNEHVAENISIDPVVHENPDRNNESEIACDGDMKDSTSYRIKEMNAKHTSAPSFYVKNVKSSWLTEKYIDDFKTDPGRKVRKNNKSRSATETEVEPSQNPLLPPEWIQEASEIVVETNEVPYCTQESQDNACPPAHMEGPSMFDKLQGRKPRGPPVEPRVGQKYKPLYEIASSLDESSHFRRL